MTMERPKVYEVEIQELGGKTWRRSMIGSRVAVTDVRKRLGQDVWEIARHLEWAGQDVTRLAGAKVWIDGYRVGMVSPHYVVATWEEYDWHQDEIEQLFDEIGDRLSALFPIIGG
jgi:hypothetical protein